MSQDRFALIGKIVARLVGDSDDELHAHAEAILGLVDRPVSAAASTTEILRESGFDWSVKCGMAKEILATESDDRAAMMARMLVTWFEATPEERARFSRKP